MIRSFVFPTQRGTSALPYRFPYGRVLALLLLSLLAWPETGAAAGASAPSPFDIHPSLEIQLVAGDSLLASPVAIAFDEAGRLYVAEMLDYPDRKNGSLGRVSVLEDTDGDGRFDRSRIFADHLAWLSGIVCYDGGIFVASTPDLIYLKDTDGDGRADLRQVVFTGFGRSVPNPVIDMVFNGFAWGLDNRIYGSTASNGGRVTRIGTVGEPLDLKGLDFSFDPVGLELRAESGTGQYGVSFDDFGQRFVSSNNRHLMMAMYDYRYAARNPFYRLPPSLLDIGVDGPAAEVYRTSSVEEWRVLRTQWRVSGRAAGAIEGGGRAAGYFTSACGVTIYRGDALPREFYGNAFVAEPAGNLVHRKLLSADGVALAGRRAPEEEQTEVLRSTDLQFRPVNFANGPDGALYVVDMHRTLIELAAALPDEILRKVDVYGGRNTGRIYRIAAKGNGPKRLPTLTGRTTAELVAQLESPNGWTRDTAARLLFERQDRSAVSQLEDLSRRASRADARVRALYVLDGLRALEPRHVEQALGDVAAEVREQAVKLAERFLSATPTVTVEETAHRTLRARVLQLAADPAKRVRYQLAFTIGELPGGNDIVEALFRIVSNSLGDDWISAASLCAMNDTLHPLFLRVTNQASLLADPGGMQLVEEMLGIIGSRARSSEIADAVEFLSRLAPESTQMRLAVAFFAGLKRGNLSLREADPGEKLAGLFAVAAVKAGDASAPESERVMAIRLAALDPAGGSEWLYALLRPMETQQIQIAAIAALAIRPTPTLAAELTNRWNGFTAPVRQRALNLLITQPARILVLLAGMREQKIQRADLSASQIQFLRNHPDTAVREEAEAVFAATIGNRLKVIDNYQAALTLAPEATRGREVFRIHCAACHRLEGEGFELGPDLLGVKNHGKDGLLIDILDPNRRVDPAYLFYQIGTQRGEVLMGAVVEETPSSITVKQPQGVRTVLSRTEIATMKASAQSLMPEGLEAAISPQQMADLLEYIIHAR